MGVWLCVGVGGCVWLCVGVGVRVNMGCRTHFGTKTVAS